MKPKPIWGLALLVALAPLAWAGQQAAQSNAAASSQTKAHAGGQANLAGGQAGSAIHSGTKISARLLTSLNAKKAKPGERVEAKVTQNVKQNGHVVIRKNSRLLGHVVSAHANGKGNANSQVQVVFDRLIQGNTSTALNTVVTSIVSVPMASMPEPMAAEPQPMAEPAPMSSGDMSGGGGAVAGVGGAVGPTVGGAVGTVGGIGGSAAGDVGATADSTVGAADRTDARAMGSAADAVSVTNSIGAIDAATATGASGAASAGTSRRMANAGLAASGNASNETAATSTFSRRNGNLELDSGTQMQFQVAGSAHARTPTSH